MTKHPSFAGMGAPARKQHQTPGAAGRTDEWLTPRAVIEALGGAQSFDLDPATPAVQPWPTARARFTKEDNGLLHDWWGRVFLNPPYSQILFRKFLARMAGHNRGTALIFARTDTAAFHRYAFDVATAAFWFRGRLVFHRPDGSQPTRTDGTVENAGAPSVLLAYGMPDADVLASLEESVPGRFTPLRIPRGVMLIFPPLLDGRENQHTWRQVVAQIVSAARGPVAIADLYRALADHPKSRRNAHWQAKVRQQLQQGPFERVSRGQWRAKAA